MNPITWIVNTTASGAITEAGVISTGDFGQIIIFFLAFSMLTAVVALVYGAIRRKG